MKKFLVYGLTAGVLFFVSASISIFLQKKKPDEKTPSSQNGSTPREEPPLPRLTKASDLKPEDASMLFKSLKDRESSVQEREKQLLRREQTVKVVLDDLKNERVALDALRKQIAVELKAVGEKLSEVDTARGALAKDQVKAKSELEQLKREAIALTADERTNSIRTASIYDKLDPASAAEVMRDLTDRSKFDDAVKILIQMKETKAAQVLAAMEPSLAAQFTERMQRVRRNPIVPVGPSN